MSWKRVLSCRMCSAHEIEVFEDDEIGPKHQCRASLSVEESKGVLAL